RRHLHLSTQVINDVSNHHHLVDGTVGARSNLSYPIRVAICSRLLKEEARREHQISRRAGKSLSERTEKRADTGRPGEHPDRVIHCLESEVWEVIEPKPAAATLEAVLGAADHHEAHVDRLKLEEVKEDAEAVLRGENLVRHEHAKIGDVRQRC